MGSFAVKDVPVLCSVLSQESRDRARPTRMYFERWGLLAPPSGKADVLEGYVSGVCFSTILLYLDGTRRATCGVRAFRRARNCPSIRLDTVEVTIQIAHIEDANCIGTFIL